MNQPRRGRPRRIETTQSATAEMETPEAASSTQPKRRRRSSTGDFALKLGGVPKKEGFIRRWVNDDKNRLAEVEQLAYTHVNDAGVQSSDTGGRISRLVGTKATGEPLRAYLMETPTEEYQFGVDEREADHRQVEAAIISPDRDTTGLTDNRYGQGSIKTAPR